ncbi:MAG: diguanylate cyclase [Armatimonadota bacterium]
MMRLTAYHKKLLLGTALACVLLGGILRATGAERPLELALTLPCVLLGFAVYLSTPATDAEVRMTPRMSPAKTRRLARIYRDTAQALASAIAAKDTYEQRHVHRVQAICELVAHKMGLSSDEIEGIAVAALLHDVGKLGVPEHILLKPGPLDADEFAKMANHAAIGAQILENVDYPWNVAEMVRHHHEKYDGTGYPDRLAGEQIPLGARIIAVAEVYDALVSDRCYRRGWTHKEAVEHIEKLSCAHFDPRVVNAFKRVEADLQAVLGAGEPAENSACREPARSDDRAAAEAIAQANRELLSLLEIAETLSSTLELDEVLALLAHRTRRLTEAATCVVFLVDPSNPRELVARAAVGRHQEAMTGARVRIGKGVTGKAASRLRPHLGSYDPNDIAFASPTRRGLDIRSCLVAPMVASGQMLGTINLYDESPRAFSNDDLRTLAAIAGRAALAIQNAVAFERVRDSAMKDALTGLYNSRYLCSYLEHEISRAARHGDHLSVLGLDLDNFKAVNDSFGHARGDEVLRDVAALFLRQVRDYDVVARNGGDEFVIVLPGTTVEEAIQTAQRIQNEVASYAHRKLPKSPHPLGVSIGVAAYPENGQNVASLLRHADAEMYRDKRSRQQVPAAA